MSLRTNVPLVEWMDKEGYGDEFMKNFDWSKFGMETTQEEMGRIEAPTARFFLAHTKKELFEGALKHGVQLYPVYPGRHAGQSAACRQRILGESGAPRAGNHHYLSGSFCQCLGGSTTDITPRPANR